jgi:acyl-coenzyme A synthetase/AMP-(fatty) acid ligase
MNFQHEPLNLYTNFKKAAQKFPETAIYFDEHVVAFPELELETTYAKCHEALVNKAAQLREIGVKKGEKVIIFKSAKFDSYLLAVAVSYIGAVPAMISYHLPAPTMDVLSERLEMPWIIYDYETAHTIDAMTQLNMKKNIRTEDLAKIKITQQYPQQLLDTNEISYLTHTSGTTGIPKLIAHSANSMGYRWVLQREVMNWIDDKQALLAFHISPVHSRFNIGVSSLMTFGFPFMPISDISKENMLKILPRYQPYAFETHPNNFVQLAKVARDFPEQFSSIRYLHSTFDAINNDTMAAFLESSKWENPVFLQIYGQSECGPMIWKKNTLQSLKTSNAREMGVGMEGLSKARVADEQGNELPANTPGHIHFLSKGRALTYYKEDERFAQASYGDWWDTGDWGIMDEQGILYLYDRQVDLNENLESNLAIEDLLLDKHNFLDEVVMIRDKNGRPQPILSVAAEKEMDWDAWWKSIEDMPFLNKPIIMKFEDIPRTATMKVQRLKLEHDLYGLFTSV